jgi:hypothetical protein
MSSFDLNGDGYIDAVDTDGDGYIDAVDTNADGYADTYDTNADGYVDTTDYDGDGFADAAPAGSSDVDAHDVSDIADSGYTGSGASSAGTNPYTQSELDAGYSQSDTSFIEPSRFADDSSLISDNDTSSNL